MTYTSKLVSPFALKPEDIDLRDIAWGLSHIYRYGGQSDPGITVAEHSILVARIMGCLTADMDPNQWPGGVANQQELQRMIPYALLHDASEAYLHDVPAPLKPAFRIIVGDEMLTYEQIEARIQEVVAKRFGLDVFGFINPLLKEADLIARDVERSQFRNMKWNTPVVPPSCADIRLSFWTPQAAFGPFELRLKAAGLS